MFNTHSKWPPLIASLVLHVVLASSLAQVDVEPYAPRVKGPIQITMEPASNVPPSAIKPAPAPKSSPPDLPSLPQEAESEIEDPASSLTQFQSNTPVPEPDLDAVPFLLKDRLSAPETEAIPEKNSPLIADKNSRSKKLGELHKDQRGAGVLINPEEREVFPDTHRVSGGQRLGKDEDTQEHLFTQEKQEQSDAMASRTRDLVPDPNKRRSESQPSKVAKLRKTSKKPDRQSHNEAKRPGPQSPNRPALPKKQQGEIRGEKAKSMAPSKTWQLDQSPSLSKKEAVKSPIRMAQLQPTKSASSKRPQSHSEKIQKETPASEASQGHSPGQDAPIAYSSPSTLALPEKHNMGQNGIQSGLQKSTDRKQALADQQKGADNNTTRAANTSTHSKDQKDDPNKDSKWAKEGRSHNERLKDLTRSALLGERPTHSLTQTPMKEGLEFDRVALLKGLVESTPAGQDGRVHKDNPGAASAPPPGGGSRIPQAVDGPGGSSLDGQASKLLSPDVLKELSDQSGKMIASLDPGQFLDLSAEANPYWTYFSRVARRFQRAWDKKREENPYFNVENDAATVRIVVVLNQKGKVEASTFLERSLTDLDQVVEDLVRQTRLGRFPRGYPDTLVVVLRVETTGR